jgi:hypothetical protein
MIGAVTGMTAAVVTMIVVREIGFVAGVTAGARCRYRVIIVVCHVRFPLESLTYRFGADQC